MKQKRREFFLLNAGVILVALGVYFFKYPNHFSTGGVSGLSILLGKVFPALSPGTYVLIINGIFLLLGFALLSRGFGVKTVYCSIVFSLLLRGFELFFPLRGPLTDQPMLELFFAVILPAFGSGILFNLGASTGGTDIAAMIFKKYTRLDIGIGLLCSDVLIAGSTFFLFDIKTGLYSVLGLILKSTLVDSVIESLNRRKSVTIITDHAEEICRFITEELHRSATFWDAEGAYTEMRRRVLLTALGRTQAVQLRNYVRQVDPHAFLVISNSSEIFGKGFLRS